VIVMVRVIEGREEVLPSTPGTGHKYKVAILALRLRRLPRVVRSKEVPALD